MSSERMTCHFKLVLLGNAGVGKSCLVLRFVRNEFFEDQETTIGGAWSSECSGCVGGLFVVLVLDFGCGRLVA